MLDIPRIQNLLRERDLDAWMIYDFRGNNSIAWKICDIKPHAHCTRRWAVIIPRSGEACKVVSAIEAHTLGHLDIPERRYSNAVEWEAHVKAILPTSGKIAMEYSAMNALPVVSKVDAGTVEWLRAMGHSIHSSADLTQELQAVWTTQQLEENLRTAEIVRATMMDAMTFIKEKLHRKQRVTEFDVQQHIVRSFEENDLQSDSEPIVAIAANASSPHYAPEPERNSAIGDNDLVLIDMWAKGPHEWSTYADITWMCHTGSSASPQQQEIFTVVRDARNAALKLVRERFAIGKELRGYEVDDAARAVINAAGYGQYFIHRTGHNIGEETHGAGANMDNFETHDDRLLLRGTSFSIEPGIYIPGTIGVRSEISVIIDAQGSVLVPSEPIQQELIFLS